MTTTLTRAVDELYNLENDPYELSNLIADSDYTNVLTEMQEQLSRLLEETDY